MPFSLSDFEVCVKRLYPCEKDTFGYLDHSYKEINGGFLGSGVLMSYTNKQETASEAISFTNNYN